MRFGFIVLALFALLTTVADTPADGSERRSQLADLLSGDSDAGFEKANRPRQFSFPADHGPHEKFRNEWWYVTGNLDGSSGRRFGYELTIFRFSLTPSAPESASDWRTNQVYIAHLAVTDAEDNRFYVAERFSRGSAGLAGARAVPLRVWIDDWEISSVGEDQPWRIVASDDSIAVNLELTPLKAPVLNGDAGLSKKSSTTDSASYYYAITRLQTEGTLTVNNETHSVSGLSWLDREWSTSALAPDQAGWDWFALQLSDGTDVMLYNIRRTNGAADPESSGTITFADGRSETLRQQDFEIRVGDTWDSPAGGTYPARWRVQIPAHGLDVEVEPVIANQELFTTVRYWEGAVDVAGTRGGEPIEGRGYVELTGYAE